MPDLIDRILNLVENSGKTAKEILEELEISKSSISEWKKRKARPSSDAVIKLANYFDVSTDYLLIGKETTSSMPISKEDDEWLQLIHQLPSEKKYEFKGELKGYIRRMEEDTVAAESSSDKVTKKSLA